MKQFYPHLSLGALALLASLALGPGVALGQQPPTCTTGLVETFYPSGEKASAMVQAIDATGECVVDGLARTWFDNGNLRFKGTFAMGVPTGTHKYWHSSGALVGMLPYQNGVLDGLFESRYPNGVVRMKGPMVGGKRDGLWVTYHNNGQMESEGSYSNDQTIGAWTYWTPSGQEVSNQ